MIATIPTRHNSTPKPTDVIYEWLGPAGREWSVDQAGHNLTCTKLASRRSLVMLAEVPMKDGRYRSCHD